MLTWSPLNRSARLLATLLLLHCCALANIYLRGRLQ